MGRRHQQHWALQQASAAELACPFCSAPVRDRGALRAHIREACTHLTHDFMQPGFVRAAPAAALDADERYVALHVVRLTQYGLMRASDFLWLALRSRVKTQVSLLAGTKPLTRPKTKLCVRAAYGLLFASFFK